MESEILDGVARAVALVLSGDPEVVDITARSIAVCGAATLLATGVGLPLAIALALGRFRGREAVLAAFNALLGMPTVALGLILYLLLSRRGPLGLLRLLYSPAGVVVGQAALVTPIVVSLIASAVEAVDPAVRDLARTLGASELEASLAVLSEAKAGALLAIVAAFNRAIAELGIALMVGGNIRGATRVLTTAIALETARGEIAMGIALGMVLLLVVFALSLTMSVVRKRLR